MDEFEKIHNESCDNINFSISVFMIKCYSFLQMNVQKCIRHLYSYEPIQNITDNVYYFANIIKSKMVTNYTEPRDIFWTCICFADFDNDSDKYMYQDFYPMIVFEKEKIRNLLVTYNYLYKDGNYYHRNAKVCENTHIFECLILLKHYYQCISRICNSKIDKIDMNFTPSTVRLISVVYSHPEMKDTIPLKIDDMYYLVDNQILSPIFILRLLKYQRLSYVFDENYQLEVMDDNVNVIHLTSDKYLFLQEDKYTVMDI